jgi:phosphohistidine phosphatase
VALELVVVRHDVAEPRDPAAAAQADAERPLTKEGRKRAAQAARALARLIEKADVVASSPLVRARDTAAPIADELGGLARVETPALAPGAKPAAFAEWLRGLGKVERVVVVGHEPDLSALVTWLVSGLSTPWLELGKGGACLVELPTRIAPGQGKLAWLLRPGQLRRLR